MKLLRYLAATGLTALALAACASGSTSTPQASATASTAIKHVVMIVEENHSANLITSRSMPYLTSQVGVKFSNYKNIVHPSLPNYFALTAGNTLVSKDCGTSTSGCMQSVNNIYHQADSLGGWGQWSESMKTNCQPSNSKPYVVHHAPAPFFNDLTSTDCKVNDVPLVKTAVPPIGSKSFVFITPNLNDDAHDGTLNAADNWLKVVIPQIKSDPAYQDGSTLIEVTFDESGGGGNSLIYTKLINPALGTKTITTGVNHYSLLRVNEELLGLPLLGKAQTAVDFRSQLGGL